MGTRDFQESWFWANKLVISKLKVSLTTKFKILTVNITKNQNFSSDNVLLFETFKDAYLFDKDGGILAGLYDISAKLHRVSNCVPPSGPQRL